MVQPPIAAIDPAPGRFIVTADVAQAWLGCFTRNKRPLRVTNLSRIKGVLNRREFRYNGQPVIISLVTGTILNGRHRLEACAATGQPIDVLIVLDVPDEAFKTMDKGASRSNADDLAIDGERNAYALAATIAWVWRWEQHTMQQSDVPSPAQCADVLHRHPGIRDSLAFERTRLKRLYGGSAVAFTHFVAGLRHPKQRDLFFEALASGTGLSDGSPVLLLRDRLLENARSKSKLPPLQLVALYIKAWTAFQAGRRLRYLRWRQDGNEKFPELP